MTLCTTLLDEEGRLAALSRYDVLDTAPEAAFDKITSLVRTVLNVPIAAVSLIDRDRQWLKSKQGVEGDTVPRDIAFCDHTIRTHQALVIPDAAADPRFATNPMVTGAPFIRSYAGVPLSSPDGYNVGALCAVDIVARTFDSTQIAILTSFADLVVDELELRLIAQTDFLTGASTRRAFLADLETASGRFARTGEQAVLVTLDVDRFKSINDTLGHAAGDVVLKRMVEACRTEMRKMDSLGRLGGEEFGILLSNIRLPEAMQVAERLRGAVAAMQVPGHPALRVTASFGVAPLLRETRDPAQWLRHADEATYAAKRAGRNRCLAAGPLLP